MAATRDKLDQTIDIGPPTSAWQLLQLEQRHLEACLRQLKSIPEESEKERFHQLIDLFLERLTTIANIEERIVEKMAVEQNLDRNGNLRVKITEIGDNGKAKPSGSAASMSPEAA